MVDNGEPGTTETHRTERLIAGARVVLAAFALLALRLDASQPERFAELTLDLVAAYLVYSIVLAGVAWFRAAAAHRARLPCHVFDLAMFCAVNLITHGTASPFFVFFVFALVSAALRWQWRGTLATAAVLLGMFLAIGGYSARGGAGGEFELNLFVIRSAYLGVVAVLLGYLGDHERRLRRQAAKMAAIDERVRMARDLHDGVIQGLTGAALKLRAIRPSIERDEKTRETLDGVLHLLATEQRELRGFMSSLGPAGEAHLDDGMIRLRELPAKLERHWGLRVELSERLHEAGLPAALGREIYRLVNEALVNSARHGSATTARVELGSNGDEVEIAVVDDGRGFPFTGDFDLDELNRLEIGPRSLKQRVEGLGGGLRLASNTAGSRLDIRLPLAGRAG